MSDKWNGTTKEHPCPICGNHGHCGVATNGSACICHYVKSDEPQKRGGWRHELRKITPEDFPPEKRYSKQHGKPTADMPMGAGGAGALHLALVLEAGARRDGRQIETKILMPEPNFKDFREQYNAKKKGGG